LAPYLEELDLSHNTISSIENLIVSYYIDIGSWSNSGLVVGAHKVDSIGFKPQPV